MPDLNAVLYALALLCLAFGSYSDFRKREVPDWISYSLITGALGIRLLFSAYSLNINYFLDGLFGFLALLALGHVAYYARQWGGGDAKILMGIGAVLGLSFDLAIFLILLMFVGAFYGVIYSLVLAAGNMVKFRKEFRNNLIKAKQLILPALLLIVLSVAASFIVTDAGMRVLVLGIGIIVLIGLSSFLFVKSVEQCCLFRRVRASELTEGDWIAETIKINGRTIITPNNTGVTKEQIRKMSSYSKLILIRLGIPFIPAFLLTFILFLFVRTWVITLITFVL